MSNVTPQNGPNRLFRYVDPSVLPGYNTVSILDKTKNLLLINRELFPLLPKHEQQRVWNTDQAVIEIATNDFDYFSA